VRRLTRLAEPAVWHDSPLRVGKTWGKVGCYLILPLVFWLVPTSRVEAGPSLCLIRRIFGVPCPGCGMTRALSCAVHGHPRRAIAYNNRVIIVLPLLVYAWMRGLRQEWRSLQAARASASETIR
jgi:uncharacterized protein DUF2752